MIYKGCEKRMIMIKNTGSELFEEAYFILSTKKSSDVTSDDMIKEANRIVSENDISLPAPKKPKSHITGYILGFLSGVGAAGLVLSFFI
ncbi:MAG: hypothetical protein IKT46_00405 [Clostridia bacterium]|nr:hypothetical protein [Clostridia bacterium]